MPYKLAVVTSHVIQYQDPLFRHLATHGDLDVTVYFCSREGAVPYRDTDLGTEVQWDLELLAGYKHSFIRNYAPRAWRDGFFGLINPGLLPALRAGRYDAVLVQVGWGSLSGWITYATCLGFGIPYLIYGDSSFIPHRVGVRRRLRDGVLRALFRRAAGFMIVGAFNADYYRHYGADPSRFFPMPWAIDNERFERESAIGVEERETTRATYGVGQEQVVLLFSGKLIERKNPLHLLQAVQRMRHGHLTAVFFLGGGDQEQALREYAKSNGLAHVHFFGFVNQRALPRIYALADVFVLPSSFDPRGSVTNEAMACGLPVIVSDKVGVYGPGDILRDGENGYVYPAGDIAALAQRLDTLVADPSLRRRMGQRSRELIAQNSFAKDAEGVVEAVKHICGSRPAVTMASVRSQDHVRAS